MKTLRNALLFSLFVATAAAGQSQAHIAQQLLSDDVPQRYKALQRARAIGPENLTSEVRSALISALQRENAISHARRMADRRGKRLDDRATAELYIDFAEAVVALRDPRAIPALADALGIGMPVMQTLAEFGDQAVPAITAVIASPDSGLSQINDGLHTLTLMLNGGHVKQPLTREAIRRTAQQRLTGRQSDTTLLRAIDLAAALGDTELMKLVEPLANDWREVHARGVDDFSLIERVQRQAASALTKK